MMFGSQRSISENFKILKHCTFQQYRHFLKQTTTTATASTPQPVTLELKQALQSSAAASLKFHCFAVFVYFWRD
jgi:hypothetical protein